MNSHQSPSQRSSKDNDYSSGSGAPCLVFSQAGCFADLRDFIFIIGSSFKIKIWDCEIWIRKILLMKLEINGREHIEIENRFQSWSLRNAVCIVASGKDDSDHPINCDEGDRILSHHQKILNCPMNHIHKGENAKCVITEFSLFPYLQFFLVFLSRASL